ncbi:hypothetical protein MOV58_05710 [Staphylococcus hominis]|uniref:hypothetical protein n=1 Tax=Staphylococcus hominis TaxID=1290 RepID=UPI0010D1B94A|nr:hypothetical protein [Staphylococcus hominis]MCI2852844.1 hypothetical protein [Staphylococcus hominis]TBW92690.1 hypothetical protein EQ808_05225 [Staphylococcus hominis]UNQ69073.1 hypothetical protein MOV58_05710 [Staphylococcus hominis]
MAELTNGGVSLKMVSDMLWKRMKEFHQHGIYNDLTLDLEDASRRIAQILKYNDVKEVTNRDEFEEYFAIGVKY